MLRTSRIAPRTLILVGAIDWTPIPASAQEDAPEPAVEPPHDSEQQAAAPALEVGSNGGDEEAVEVVVHAERAPEPTGDGFQLSATTRPATVRQAGAQSLVDAMRGQPSVSVQQTTPGQGTVYIRGFSGRSVLHVVDGVRLNTAFFRAGNNPYVSLVDPHSLERIDVVPGPSSVEYGSDGMGGALVMRTRLSGYSSPARVLGGYYQSLSSNPLGSVSHLNLARSSDTFVVDVGLSLFGISDVVPGGDERPPLRNGYLGLRANPDGTFEPPRGTAQEGTGFDYYHANAALRTKLGTGLEWIQRAAWSLRPELLRYDQVTQRFDTGAPSSIDRALRPMFRWVVSSELVHRSLDAWYNEANVLLAWQRIGEHRERLDLVEACSFDTPASGPCPEPVFLVADSTLQLERNVSDKLSASSGVRLGRPNAKRVTRLGLDVAHDIITSAASTLDIPTRRREADSPRYPDGSSLTELGLFAVHQEPVLADVDASVGVRGSSFLLDIASRGDPSPSEPLALNLFDVAFSAGLRWEATSGLWILGNLGRGLRAPNVQDLASLGPRAGDRFQVPNPDLESETSLGADVGMRVVRRTLRGQVSLFWLEQDNAIVLAPTTLDGSSVTPSGEGVVESVNASSVENWGSEAHIELDVSKRARVFTRWLLMIGTQKNPEGTDLPSSTPADRVPPLQGSAGMSYDLSKNLTVEAFARGRKRQQRLNNPINLDDNRIPLGGTPGFLTYHARGTHRIDGQHTLRLSLDNLTNELVLEHGSGFYGPGFGATVSLEGEF